MVWGHTEIPEGECHRHENRFRKEMTRFQNFRNKWLFGMDAGGCADKSWQFFCTCAEVFLPKWWSRLSCTSLNDVTMFSHARKGGNYKRGSTTKLEEFGCCYYCHLGVLAQALGSLQSHRPSTLAVLSAPRVGSITWMCSVLCFCQ